jgi:hypothetical protein
MNNKLNTRALSNFTNVTPSRNLIFTNIVPYLNELFQKNPIILFTNKELTIPEIVFSFPLKQVVFMEDEIIENNLRVIDSYLPELLYAFSAVSNQSDSINQLIEKVSKKNFAYSKPTYLKILLKHKIIGFIEVMLFADIHDGVWDGRLNTNKCYVYKEDTELEYYHYYQVRTLLVKLLDKISISSTRNIENGNHHINIAFQFQ